MLAEDTHTQNGAATGKTKYEENKSFGEGGRKQNSKHVWQYKLATGNNPFSKATFLALSYYTALI